MRLTKEFGKERCVFVDQLPLVQIATRIKRLSSILVVFNVNHSVDMDDGFEDEAQPEVVFDFVFWEPVAVTYLFINAKQKQIMLGRGNLRQ